jgi:Protein of unknown function (DUF3096)
LLQAGSRQPAMPPNSSRAALFLEQRIVVRCNFRHFSDCLEPVAATSVCYRGTAQADKMQVSIRHFPSSIIAERFHMTLTTAHISPIMSVIAGLLILIMPRLLNLVVAIFLILNGLIGLGLLKWLHM